MTHQDSIDDQMIDDEPEDHDDGIGDCALDMETGQCGHAGSEQCDFDCPWRDSSYFAGSDAWYRARGKEPPR